MQNRAIRNLTLISALALPLSGLQAQQVLQSSENVLAKPAPPAASAPTAVPALIPYSGMGIGADGKVITGEVPVTFLIYKDETGGEPLFTESQTADFDTAGHYAVELGATLSSGIPINLFGTGEARWLEVQIAGAKVQARTLLVSVPYALKQTHHSHLRSCIPGLLQVHCPQDQCSSYLRATYSAAITMTATSSPRARRRLSVMA